MSQLKDADVKNMKPGSKSKVESLGKSRGALVFRKVADTTTGYYRYWKGKQSIFIKLGVYKATSKSAGFTLAQLREKALELAATRQQIAPQDLKEYLGQKEAGRKQAAEEQQRHEEIEASQGTLEDLCLSYTEHLRRRGVDAARKAEVLFTTYCFKPFPAMVKKKARDVTPDDIVKILGTMIQKGITTTSNRVRTYLHAAFNHGLKADHDPRQQAEQGKRFYLNFNPVAAVPRQADYERVRERRLSTDEVRGMWLNFDNAGPPRSPLYGLLIKFCLACFGNRPQQIVRCTWDDIDLEARTLTFIDRKGKGGRPKKRVIPLSKIALSLLDEIRAISGSHKWPFSITGRVIIKVDNLGRAIRDYNDLIQQQAIDNGQEPPERWTAKDFRRTATNFLTYLRVPREQRYLLQSREDGSVESRHYDHDDRIPEKRDSAKVYDKYLEQIITGTLPDKLVDIEQFRMKKNKQ